MRAHVSNLGGKDRVTDVPQSTRKPLLQCPIFGFVCLDSRFCYRDSHTSCWKARVPRLIRPTGQPSVLGPGKCMPRAPETCANPDLHPTGVTASASCKRDPRTMVGMRSPEASPGQPRAKRRPAAGGKQGPTTRAQAGQGSRGHTRFQAKSGARASAAEVPSAKREGSGWQRGQAAGEQAVCGQGSNTCPAAPAGAPLAHPPPASTPPEDPPASKAQPAACGLLWAAAPRDPGLAGRPLSSGPVPVPIPARPQAVQRRTPGVRSSAVGPADPLREPAPRSAVWRPPGRPPPSRCTWSFHQPQPPATCRPAPPTSPPPAPNTPVLTWPPTFPQQDRNTGRPKAPPHCPQTLPPLPGPSLPPVPCPNLTVLHCDPPRDTDSRVDFIVKRQSHESVWWGRVP